MSYREVISPQTIWRLFSNYLARNIYSHKYGKISSLATNAMGIIGVLAILLIWEIASRFSPSFLLPTPIVVFHQTNKIILSPDFFWHASLTLKRVLFSSLIAIAISNFLAITSVISDKFSRLWKPFIAIGLLIPGVVAIFLGIVVFGSRGPVSQVIVTLLLIPEIFLILLPAYQTLDNSLAEVASVYRVTKSAYVMDIIVPQVLPFLFSSLRVGLSVGWKLIILSEVFTLSNGVGYQVYYYFNLFSIKNVLAWLLGFVFIMSSIEYLMILPLEKKFTFVPKKNNAS